MRYVIPSQDKIFPFSYKHGTNDADCTLENNIGTKGKHSIAFNIFSSDFFGFQENFMQRNACSSKKKTFDRVFLCRT